MNSSGNKKSGGAPDSKNTDIISSLLSSLDDDDLG